MFSQETQIRCLFCGEKFTIVVDPSQDIQEYTEDCSVCCHPLNLKIACADGEIESVVVARDD